MFWRIVRRLIAANRGRLIVILLALGAGAAVTAALLNLQIDAKKRLTTEFRVFRRKCRRRSAKIRHDPPMQRSMNPSRSEFRHDRTRVSRRPSCRVSMFQRRRMSPSETDRSSSSLRVARSPACPVRGVSGLSGRKPPSSPYVSGIAAYIPRLPSSVQELQDSCEWLQSYARDG